MKEILQPLIKQFMPFAKKRMGFNKPPRIFLRDDPHNAQDPLGKTAYYDPEQRSVTLYINGRHPKDVMRSLSHELVHHTQNCNGEFDQTRELGDGYAQTDEHLREMERQAYEQGNMCFRDWEDSIKGTIYIQNMNVNIQKEGKTNMSTKDWKNNELKTLLTERWGFSFNLLNESQEEVVEEAEEATEEVVEEQQEELEEVASSSGRGSPTVDRRGDDERKRPMEEGEQMFAPSHYCIHHGGVMHDGQVQMAEAVQHVEPNTEGFISHYDMKLSDGTILENVAAEDIQVTNASLAEEHNKDKHKKMKKMEEESTEKYDDAPELTGKQKDLPDGLQKAIINKKTVKKEGLDEAKIRQLVRNLLEEAVKRGNK